MMTESLKRELLNRNSFTQHTNIQYPFDKHFTFLGSLNYIPLPLLLIIFTTFAVDFWGCP